jgi:hypothetical protein
MNLIKSIAIMGALFGASSFANTADAYCYIFEDSNTGQRWAMGGSGAQPAGQLDMRTNAERQGRERGANLNYKLIDEGTSECNGSWTSDVSIYISYRPGL